MNLYLDKAHRQLHTLKFFIRNAARRSQHEQCRQLSNRAIEILLGLPLTDDQLFMHLNELGTAHHKIN